MRYILTFHTYVMRYIQTCKSILEMCICINYTAPISLHVYKSNSHKFRPDIKYYPVASIHKYVVKRNTTILSQLGYQIAPAFLLFAMVNSH